MTDPGVNDQHSGAQQPIDAQMVSPGALLAAYRKERGWTVEQVASQLNLAPRQIVAIESDDYPALPGMPIVRGFIRAYAKLLKVDAAPLLATLGGETVLVHESIEPKKSLSTPFSEARLPSMTERQPMSSKWVLGFLLLVLLGVAIWAARHEFAPESAPKPVASAPQVSESLATTPVAPGNERQDVLNEKADTQQLQTQPAPPAPQVGEAPAPAANAGVPAPMLVPATPAQPVPVPEIAPSAAKDALVLKAREDSWVEVRRTSNNAVLLSRIVKAGETENVEVSEPVSLLIGNAGGLDVSLRGSPVEVKPKANSNVARLNLK